MRLLRVGVIGSERPAVLLEDDRLVDCSTIVFEYDNAFFSTGSLGRLATIEEVK